VNQSSWYHANLAFQLFYRGFCSVSSSGWRVAYEFSVDAVGVGAVEPLSTTTRQGQESQDHTCGRYFPGSSAKHTTLQVLGLMLGIEPS
jgi:hypothetical protein